MGSPAPSQFPTLAEVLSRSFRDAPAGARLVAVCEGPSADADVRAILPDGSVVANVTAEAIEVSGATYPPTMEGLAALVRSSAGHVLLLSSPTLPARPDVTRLVSALESDSACTTVSLDDHARPTAPGLSPPALDVPRPGVVLVRRDDLLLASDEADLAESYGERPPVRGCGRFVASVLDPLDRPGFVHRAVGTAMEPSQPGHASSARQQRKTEARILVDGSFLAHRLAGTQVQALALVRALVRAGVDLAVLRPREIHPTVAPSLAELSGQIPVLDRERVGRPDVVHRMSQIFSLHELADRLVIGERFVLTHQDMIWDRTPAYHVGDGRRDYRRATAATLELADHVGFFSLHAALDAASDGGLELDRATVVPLGVDHLSSHDVPDAPARPLDGRPYLLMVGSSFRHKNRVFSLRLLHRLVEWGWEGGLVLVGGESGSGSSAPAEQRFLDGHAELDGRVRSLGHVEEAEQLALYRDAELVLFPSLYEGFGFIPFEAAALGTASVYTQRSSMGELLPAAGALPSFDLDEAAEHVLRLLGRPDELARIVAEISARAATLTWERTAAGYRKVYERALARPQRASVPVLRAARELASRAAPTAHEALLLDVYRRRRGSRLVVDTTFRLGTAVRRGARAIRPPGRDPSS